MTIRGYALNSGAYIEADTLADWMQAERQADAIHAQLNLLLTKPQITAAVTNEQPARIEREPLTKTRLIRETAGDIIACLHPRMWKA